MRYEGFGNDFVKDFWVNICNKDIHPVGWCATSGKPLVPPKSKLNIEYEPRCEKTGLRGFRPVRHKPGYTVIEDG